mmetsp:Transcript_101683/g.265177  ORF Transcript_101683/g.265177 Transcript_101683/m.265177 type:complete len:403 (-) Transcript_101683:186-1394(-)
MLHVTPRALPRGMIVALCTGSAPCACSPTSACPPSWYAVIFFSRSLIGLRLSSPTTTRSNASSMYLAVTAVMFWADERTAAMFRMLNKSAPVMPAVRLASVTNSTAGSSTSLEAYISRISVRPFRSGIGTTTCLSRRPGRIRAGSRDFTKLVAQMTTIPLFSSKPSSSTRSWFSVARTELLSRPERLEPTASISSMKMMHGACFRASAKRSRMRRAPTPTNISSNSEPEVCRNGTPASPAMARASSVLPVPGGPDIIMPLGSLAPRRVNRSGSFRYMMISSSSSLTSSQPLTSAKVVLTSSTGTTFLVFTPKPSARFCMLPMTLSAITDAPATMISITKPDRSRRHRAALLESTTCTCSGSEPPSAICAAPAALAAEGPAPTAAAAACACDKPPAAPDLLST